MVKLLRNNNYLVEEKKPDKKVRDKLSPAFQKKSYSLTSTSIKGELEEIYWDNIHITYGKLKHMDSIRLKFKRQNENSVVKMFFCLKGNSCFHFEEYSKEIQFECNRHNILHLPDKCEGRLECNACKSCNACGEWHFFEIDLPFPFFERYVSHSTHLGEKVKESVLGGIPGAFYSYNMNVCPRMHELIQEILKCSDVGLYSRSLIEAKTLELFAIQLEQIENGKCPAITNLKMDDVEKIHKAKEILLCNLNDPSPLTELALKVGTNECTLKRGFKEVFGCTVYGFLYDVRMQQARKSLLENNKPILEIAEEVGYKNATHFTNAFKRKFGILPSMLRK